MLCNYFKDHGWNMKLVLCLLAVLVVSGCSPDVRPFAGQPSLFATALSTQPEPTQAIPITTKAPMINSEISSPSPTRTLEERQTLLQTPSPSPATISAPEAPLISVSNVSELKESTLIRFESWEMVTALDWSPDGEYLAVAAGNAVYLFKLAPRADSLERLAKLGMGSLTPSLKFSPQGDLLAAGSKDGHLHVWSMSSLKTAGSQEVREAKLAVEAHKKGVNWVAFSPNESLLASAGNDAMVRLWDLETGQQVSSIIGGTYVIPCVSFTRDGAYLAIANGPRVRFRQLETGRMAATLDADAGLFSLALSPDGGTLAASALDGGVWMWQSPTAPLDPNLEVEPLVVFPDYATTSPNAFVWTLQYNINGNLLAAASTDARIYFIDPVQGELVYTLKGHNSAVTALKFNPQGTSLVSAGLDATVRLWKVEKGLP